MVCGSVIVKRRLWSVRVDSMMSSLYEARTCNVEKQ